MSKRDFRTHDQPETRYPTSECFERTGRDLLAGLALGAALLSGLAGCGDRAVREAPDAGADLTPDLMTSPPPGTMRMPPSGLDLRERLPPDAGRDLAPSSPDLPDNMGGAPMPPAPIDLGPEQD